MSTVSPVTLRSSNGVCVCGMNLCTTLVYQHQFIPCYSSANARILKPFEDSELTVDPTFDFLLFHDQFAGTSEGITL